MKHESVQTGRMSSELYRNKSPRVKVSDKDTHPNCLQDKVNGVHQKQGCEIQD